MTSSGSWPALQHGSVRLGKCEGSRLVGGTRLVVFPRCLTPYKPKNTTSRDPYTPFELGPPLPAGTPLPLLPPFGKGQEARGPGSRGGSRLWLSRTAGGLAVGIPRAGSPQRAGTPCLSWSIGTRGCTERGIVARISGNLVWGETHPSSLTKKPLTRVSKQVPGAHGKRGLERDWRNVGEGLAKGWRRVGGFPCTLQFRNSRGARLETRVCDSMVTKFLKIVTTILAERIAKFGCGFFAYSWKILAFLLCNWSFFLLTVWSFFGLQLELFCKQWETASNKGLKEPQPKKLQL